MYTFIKIKRNKWVGLNASGQLSWLVSRWPAVSAASEAAFANADTHLHRMPSEGISKFARLWHNTAHEYPKLG